MKPLLLLMAPVNTVSGYGARSRDVAHALIASDKYDVVIWPTRWGSTPQNYLNDQDEKDKLIIDRCLKDPNLPKQPEVFVQITVPNEFQRIGKFNVGITAGIETTLASPPWIEGCNKMDLVLTSSEHALNVLKGSVFEKRDNKTKQIIGKIQLEKPIEVLFEGVDPTTYFKTNDIHVSVDEQLKQVKEKEALLFVGHWLKGDLYRDEKGNHRGADRKDISGMILTFLTTFAAKAASKRPALVMKTSAADFSPIDREEMLNKIAGIYKIAQTLTKKKSLPNVYLLHGDFTNEEMNSLYNHPKIKAHVTFTKGEGYGRPLAEASLSEKPIIAPAWSGQVDFLKHSVRLDGKLSNVHPSAVWENVIMAESQWFDVDYDAAKHALKFPFEKKNEKTAQRLAYRQASYIKKNKLFEHMQKDLIDVLDKYTKDIPTEVMLKLPTLTPTEEALKTAEEGINNLSVDDQKVLKNFVNDVAPKINLPKLKKI